MLRHTGFLYPKAYLQAIESSFSGSLC